jgi:hypothetical protein
LEFWTVLNRSEIEKNRLKKGLDDFFCTVSNGPEKWVGNLGYGWFVPNRPEPILDGFLKPSRINSGWFGPKPSVTLYGRFGPKLFGIGYGWFGSKSSVKLRMVLTQTVHNIV